jgi:hypothetical protein
MRSRKGKPVSTHDETTNGNDDRPSIVIRAAAGEDAAALRRLAERDPSTILTGALIVAEQDGALRAALPLGGELAIADPFHPTEAIVGMLRLSASLWAPRVTS